MNVSALLFSVRVFEIGLGSVGFMILMLLFGCVVTAPYFAFFPNWSPDGTRIIFCMFINGGEGIYTANPDGSNIKQVTFTTNFNTLFNGPDWGTHPVTP